ncbi:hypothetical protein H7170_03300 [Candidatus Gracilibacteria bacterium]|nr:hypothetical protein [Candidatus Gracilibacteria bacterium]
MTLAQSPSEISEDQKEVILTNEAQARVNAVGDSAISLLDTNPDAKSVIANLFGEMIANNLRDPENVTKIQDGLYDARDQRLSHATLGERLSILESFSKFMTQFTQGIAQMNRDVGLSNEANALKSGSDIKISQVQSTYAQILANNHPTQTA